jgi:hypothetical protein
MERFKSPRQAQKFLAAHDQINSVFRLNQYRLSAISYRRVRADAFDLWKGYTVEMTALQTEISLISNSRKQVGNPTAGASCQKEALRTKCSPMVPPNVRWLPALIKPSWAKVLAEEINLTIPLQPL